MEEGGGHGFFVFGCYFLEEEGEEGEDFCCCWFCCCLVFFWLVGWLARGCFLVSCLR